MFPEKFISNIKSYKIISITKSKEFLIWFKQ